MFKVYRKKLNASHDSPVLKVILTDDKVVEEFVYIPLGDYRGSGAPWGMLGKNEGEVISEGFDFDLEASRWWNQKS